MIYPICDLFLCCRPASRTRVRPPAREFLNYLCEHHWQRLKEQGPDQSDCYTPMRAGVNVFPEESFGVEHKNAA
jgi:hypothetical protein